MLSSISIHEDRDAAKQLPIHVDVKAIAQTLNDHPKTIERMARVGKIPALLVGSRWRFDPSEIKKWLATKQVASFQWQQWTSGNGAGFIEAALRGHTHP